MSVIEPADRGKGKSVVTLVIFLHGEGRRSRCYGRTTALRLFVQPYDEDEDEQFFTKFYK
jgi:hypothetical protein